MRSNFEKSFYVICLSIILLSTIFIMRRSPERDDRGCIKNIIVSMSSVSQTDVYKAPNTLWLIHPKRYIKVFEALSEVFGLFVHAI